jgi:ERCC4-related helicase
VLFGCCISFHNIILCTHKFFPNQIDDFKAGRVSLLVATDVAARGLDVTSIGLVVQADAPR